MTTSNTIIHHSTVIQPFAWYAPAKPGRTDRTDGSCFDLPSCEYAGRIYLGTIHAYVTHADTTSIMGSCDLYVILPYKAKADQCDTL